MTIAIIEMPDDEHLQQVAASTCVQYWRRDFPLDTEQWYLTLYAESLESSTLPVVLVAHDNGEFVGTASLIEDDELPDAHEPGPWVAAVFVRDDYRQRGIGTQLVRQLVEQAAVRDIEKIYLYTENGMRWYESMGWSTERNATLSDHEVTVMSHVISKH